MDVDGKELASLMGANHVELNRDSTGCLHATVCAFERGDGLGVESIRKIVETCRASNDWRNALGDAKLELILHVRESALSPVLWGMTSFPLDLESMVAWSDAAD